MNQVHCIQRYPSYSCQEHGITLRDRNRILYQAVNMFAVKLGLLTWGPMEMDLVLVVFSSEIVDLLKCCT